MANKLKYRKLEPLVASPNAPTIIMMHGYGSNMDDLAGLQHYIKPEFRIICPQGPVDLGPLGMMGGHAWFDLNFDPMGGISYDETQAEGAVQTALEFLQFVQAEIADDAERVYLLGFSQGAMMAHAILLDHPKLIAGAACLSGRKVESLFHDQREWQDAHTEIPLFISHGHHDEVIPYDDAKELENYYLKSPVNLQYRSYPMGHDISPDCLNDLNKWFAEHVQ